MKLKALFAIAALAILASSDAPAQLYAGAGLGQAHMTKTACPNGFICQNREQGWKAVLGYRVNRHVSIEGAWVDLGRSNRLKLSTASPFEFGRKGTHGLATARGPAVTLLGFLPLSSRFSVYAGAGVHALKVRNEVLGRPDQAHSPFQINTAGTSLGPVWTVGAQYDFASRWAARAEFSHFHRVGGSTIGGLTEKELGVVSVLYRFGDEK